MNGEKNYYETTFTLSGTSEKATLTELEYKSLLKISEEEKAKIQGMIQGVNGLSVFPYILLSKEFLKDFKCEKFSDNKWKFSLTSDELRKKIKLLKKCNIYFFYNLK